MLELFMRPQYMHVWRWQVGLPPSGGCPQPVYRHPAPAAAPGLPEAQRPHDAACERLGPPHRQVWPAQYRDPRTGSRVQSPLGYSQRKGAELGGTDANIIGT